MIDIFIIVVLAWALFSGWRAGFVKEIVSTVGTLVGLLVAATCYSSFGKYLAVDGTETNMVTSVIAFLLLWIVVPIALGFVANVITKSIREMQLGLPNSMLGAAVNGLKYLVVLSCVFNVMQSLHILNEEKASTSKLLAPVTSVVELCLNNDDEKRSANDNEKSAVNKADTVWVDLSKNRPTSKTK